jgi:hypothetical protein
MQTWDENFINKVVHSESENVFSVNFYDRHVPTFPRKCEGTPRGSPQQHQRANQPAQPPKLTR